MHVGHSWYEPVCERISRIRTQAMESFVYRGAPAGSIIGRLWNGVRFSPVPFDSKPGSSARRWIADKFSRKRSIIATICIFIIGITVETTSDKYAMLVLGRSVSGISIGMLSAIAPVYISEISPAEIRGSLLVLGQSFSRHLHHLADHLRCRGGFNRRWSGGRFLDQLRNQIFPWKWGLETSFHITSTFPTKACSK